MAVADLSWWAVWWPWMLAWILGWLGLAVAVAVAVRRIRARRRRRARAESAFGRLLQRPTVYLDPDLVTEIYDQLDLEQKRAVQREAADVLETRRRNVAGGGQVDPAGIRAQVARATAEEFVHQYVMQAPEPDKVMRAIIEALDTNDNIVQVDLGPPPEDWEGDVGVSDGPALRHGIPGRLPTTLRLSLMTWAYILLHGSFRRVAGESHNGVADVFETVYGDPATDGAGPARIRLLCASGTKPERGRAPFPGSCLGLVRGWNPDEGTLDVEPVAIFR